ncbi:MAG: hypothetical protein AAGH15_09915, partial [Myxococcota bacterium]
MSSVRACLPMTLRSFSLVALGLFASPALAQVNEPGPPEAVEDALSGPSDQAVDEAAGCDVQVSLRSGDLLWSACPGGIVVVLEVAEGGRLTLRLRSSFRVFGEVSGFFERGGQVWAEVERREALALSAPPAGF